MVNDRAESLHFTKLTIFKENDEIDLRSLFRIFWHEKITILVVTFIAALVSVLIVLYMPNKYTADAILAPNEISPSMGNLKGLSSLVGINASNEIDETTRALEIIKSRYFINSFVKEHKITPALFAMKRWDFKKNGPIYDIDIYDPETKKWTRDAKDSPASKPNEFEIHEEFLKSLAVVPDPETNFITISIETISPVYSYQWLTWLIEDINKKVRDMKVEELDRSIAYLENKAAETQFSEIRNIFYDLMQEKIQSRLLAETKEEYILQTIDPALVPQKKSGPARALICIIGTFFGGIMGLILACFKYYRK